MSKTIEIPETVILEMQSKAYDFREEKAKHEAQLKVKMYDCNTIEKNRAYAALKLRETLDFLQEHNKEGLKQEDWFSEMGMTRESLLRQEKVILFPLEGLARHFKFFLGQKVIWSKMPNEDFTVTGITKDKLQLEGDFSQMYNIIQSDWIDMDEVEPK